MRKHIRAIQLAAKYGFKFVGITGAGHLRFHHDNGAIIVTAYSPSDYRSIRNFEADMRRAVKHPPTRRKGKQC